MHKSTSVYSTAQVWENIMGNILTESYMTRMEQVQEEVSQSSSHSFASALHCPCNAGACPTALDGLVWNLDTQITFTVLTSKTVTSPEAAQRIYMKKE